MKIKKEYIAPELTVVSFKIESGFALSSVNNMFKEDPLGLGLFSEFDDNLMEYWEFDNDPSADFGSGVGSGWDSGWER